MYKLAAAAVFGSVMSLLPAQGCFYSNLGTNLGLGDDDVAQGLALGFTFNYGGVPYTDICVTSNGYFWLGATSVTGSDFSPTEAELLAGQPRICPLWGDFNPSAVGSGQVYFNAVPASGGQPAYALITWAGVYEFGTTNAVEMQVRLEDNDNVFVTYGTNPSLSGTLTPTQIIGASPGNAAAANPIILAPRPVTSTSDTFYELIAAGSFLYAGTSMQWAPTVPGYTIIDSGCTPNTLPSQAEASTYGTGCYDNPVTYYEDFVASTFDMGGVAGASVGGFVMIPNGVGSYVVGPGTGLWFGDDGTGAANTEGAVPGVAPISASILNADDAVITIDLASIGFVNLMLVPGGQSLIETSLTVDSNGRMSVDPGLASDFTPTPQELVSGPQSWAAFWSDLSPNIQGGVHWDVDPTTTSGYVTFHDVPDFGAAAGAPANTFQMAIQPGGLIEMRYATITQGLQTMVGLSIGGGAADPGSSDIYDAASGVVNVVDLGALSVAPTLEALAAPIIGSPLDLVVSQIDPSVVFGAVLLSLIQDIPGTDLGFLGMPGCNAYIDPFQNSSAGLFFPLGAPSVTLPLVPSVPAFQDLEFYGQAGLYLPNANALNTVMTNGLLLRISAF
ncbi:MAG: hypothetical protein VYE77_04340 [Planctomycetota bacterium]|nr:hypothetical protein [Planctomycetota bacterium]